ncbi:uncharacterized protein [Rutidosis leptorrhynchoides]|uniref:uncharacterized protein n=1 Tax=Rutidosis leptorrhynchoides TaxID=125765 RepID=UPI003A98E021
MKHHNHHQTSSNAVSSSSSAAEAAVSSSSASPSMTSQPQPPPPLPSPAVQLMNATSPATDEHPASSSASRDCSSSSSTSSSSSSESVTIERRGEYAAVCKWTIFNFPRVKTRALWSKYFEVGGYDCRLLVYPKGDSQALPGYISIYLQIMDPRGTSSSKWDCFASYRLTVVNPIDDSKSVHRDSWHRFSTKKKSHGWCDFTPSNSILDLKSGFLFNEDNCLLITADILILNESINFVRDNNDLQSSSASSSVSMTGPVGDVLSGKFTWKVHNFTLFRDMIKTQKIMSPVFPAGECNLRISIYQSTVSGVDYLSMCLESKDTEKVSVSDRSCWCLFRMSVLNQKPGLNHMHRDSYGRFAADNKSGDNTSLGWNDYMKMTDFSGAEGGFLVDDTAVFSTSFHVIKEQSSFSKNGGLIGGRIVSGPRKSDGHMGKFTWRIENFTRLKDLLKKRKITGLCIKSRRFQIGNRDCRLIVYPRGQSQPPCHLSVFLEVTDSRNTTSDWSCFVSHRLSVVNQKMEDKSVTKESQNRYSKSAKDWGWREFVTLTSLFDQDSGFLVHDVVVFSAEVLILKETSSMHEFKDQENESGNTALNAIEGGKMSSFTWKVENFLSFKDIMETRKIFSRFFQAGGCELRLGVYESFDTICIYLESDQSVGTDPDKNFWVKYRMAVLNQKNPSKTVWKESSICTKTWNNSVLQFMKVSDMLEADAGFLVRDTVVFVCEILDCCPWFEFADLEVYASEDDQDALTTDPDELIDSEDSEGISGDEEDMFRNILSGAGFHLTYGDNPSQPQVTLREKLLLDAGASARFLTGLRVYLEDPAKVKRFLLPTKLSGPGDGKKNAKTDGPSPSLMNLLMGVKVLQQAIIDLLLDIMVECCQPSEESSNGDCSDRSGASSPPERSQLYVNGRLDSVTDEISTATAVQSSDANGNRASDKTFDGHEQPFCPPETCAASSSDSSSLQYKTKWPEQSEELLGLIVNSLRSFDGAVPQGCPEPRRRPESAQKIALVLDKAPKHLQPDLISLIPKLVDHSEHPLAASALLDRLKKSDAEPDLLLPALGALSQLKCNSEFWERILYQSFELLEDSNDARLAATIDFIFKAALHCQHLPEAVRSVRTRLKFLGDEVSVCVLDYLSRTVASCTDVAEAILKDIDNDDEYRETLPSMPCGTFLFGENGATSDSLHTDPQSFCAATANFPDIYILLEMLSIPCLAIESSQTFEKAVAQGAITAQSVAMVLERRLARRFNLTSQFVAENFQHDEGETIEQLRVQRDDFTSVLGLAEALGLSRDSCVRGFVKMLYTILFKWYADGPHRLRILKRLVDRATSVTDVSREVDSDLEILVFLVSEEQEFVRPVLSMMQEIADLANVDRAALWHQLCASEDEINRIREDSKAEVESMVKEKGVLEQKLGEAEATNSRLKIDMKAEMDKFASERKEMSEQIQEIESQLEWHRSERDDEIAKLTSEKKILQERLHDAETQLSQLKSRKRDELKRITKEKNTLAERLRNAEAARKRFDDELKRYATENVSREEFRQSLEDEIRRLTQTVGQTEGEKREKEEQIARCEAYIDGMESKLQTCQQYIHSLEGSLQEEMSRHAPLYGAGLEALSMKELETISRIHEEGLRQIHALQQRKGATPSASSPHMTRPHGHGVVYPGGPPPMSVGLPPTLVPHVMGVHGNGHANGAIGPWFNHS